MTSLPRPKNKVGYITIPYIRGLGEGFKHTCSKYGIQVHCKGNSTIKQELMKPKDQDPEENKSGLIYSYRCQDIACDEEYTGETGCKLGERTKEHFKHPSPIHTHIQETGHQANNNSFNIIHREVYHSVELCIKVIFFLTEVVD